MEIPASELSCLTFSFTSGGTVSLIVTLRLLLMSLRPAPSLLPPQFVLFVFSYLLYIFVLKTLKEGGVISPKGHISNSISEL